MLSRLQLGAAALLSSCGLFWLLLGAATASAQGIYAINWWSVDDGGGFSSGGSYTLTGTIGQPDAGPMTGGNYTLVGGFWGLGAGVPAPGPPALSVTLTPSNTVLVWWPLSDTSWRLQATTNLVTTGSTWTECSYQTNGTICCRLEALPTGNRFYRVRSP